MLSGQNLMILMFFLICFSSCSQIVDFQTNQTLTFNTFKQFKSKTPQLKEYLLFPGSTNPKKLNTCEKLDPTEFGANFSFAGAAVIVFGYNKCSFEKHARLVQDQGGSVAIVASGLPFNEAHFRFGKVEDLKIPIYFVTINDAIKILQTIGKNAALGAPTFLKLSDANNTWFNIGKGGYWIFLETIVLLGYLINFILGVRSIILHIKEEGFKPTIGQITLWVNMAGLVIFSMLVFDPWNLRYIASEKFVVTMLCLFAPALLTSILLMGFFFNEVLISKGFMKPQLTYLKYPFLVICLTCWAAYFADLGFILEYAVNLDVIKTVVLMNVLFFSLASIYFVCVTILILLKLSRFSSPILKRLAPLVSFIIFGIVLFIIAAIIDAEQVFSGYEARKMIAVWSLYWISSLFIYTPQFIYFREPFSKTQSKLSSEKLSKSSNKLIHLSS